MCTASFVSQVLTKQCSECQNNFHQNLMMQTLCNFVSELVSLCEPSRSGSVTCCFCPFFQGSLGGKLNINCGTDFCPTLFIIMKLNFKSALNSFSDKMK